MFEFRFDLANLQKDLGPLHLLLGRVDRNVRLVAVVQEGEDPVVLFLFQRIILVVVALGALDGQAEDPLADAVHTVEHGLHPELLRIDAPFFVDHRVAQEARGDELVLAGAGEQVTGDLLDDELAIGEVPVQGMNDPVAICVDLAGLVFLVAIRVGITRGVEPDPPPSLAVLGRVEEPVNQSGSRRPRGCRRRRHRRPGWMGAGRSGRG